MNLRVLACHTRAHCKTCRTDADWRERVTGVRDFECPHRVYWNGKRLRRRLRGLGDVLAWVIKKMGFTQQAGCGCKARQEWVNKWFPIPKWFQRFLDWVSRLWS